MRHNPVPQNLNRYRKPVLIKVVGHDALADPSVDRDRLVVILPAAEKVLTLTARDWVANWLRHRSVGRDAPYPRIEGLVKGMREYHVGQYVDLGVAHLTAIATSTNQIHIGYVQLDQRSILINDLGAIMTAVNAVRQTLTRDGAQQPQALQQASAVANAAYSQCGPGFSQWSLNLHQRDGVDGMAFTFDLGQNPRSFCKLFIPADSRLPVEPMDDSRATQFVANHFNL